MAETAAKKARTARKKFPQYRGVDLEQVLTYSNEDLMELFPARARRKFGRGVPRAPATLLKKLRVKKTEAPEGKTK